MVIFDEKSTFTRPKITVAFNWLWLYLIPLRREHQMQKIHPQRSCYSLQENVTETVHSVISEYSKHFHKNRAVVKRKHSVQVLWRHCTVGHVELLTTASLTGGARGSDVRVCFQLRNSWIICCGIWVTPPPCTDITPIIWSSDIIFLSHRSLIQLV